MADDAADVEAEQGARAVQVEDDDREVVEPDAVEAEVDAGQQERVVVPSRRAVDAQRDVADRHHAERVGGAEADRDDLAAGVDDEALLHRAVDDAAHEREAVEAHREFDVGGRLRRQLAGHHEAVVPVVDDGRHAQGQRREAVLAAGGGQAGQRRVLDEGRDVLHAQRADLDGVGAAQLQPAHADAADAGAQRVGDRPDADALRRRLRQHHLLGAGVHDEVDLVTVHAPADDHLVALEPERDGVRLVELLRRDADRHALAERPQEADLGPGPLDLLVHAGAGEIFDVRLERVRRQVVPLHAAVDRPQGVVELAARVAGDGRLQLDEPFFEPAARREAAAESVAGHGVARVRGENVPVHLLGLLEQAERPQRVGVQRPVLRIDRVEPVEEFRLLLRAGELRDVQQRLEQAARCAQELPGPRARLRVLVGRQRLPVPLVAVEQVGELQTDLGARGAARRLGADDDGRGRAEGQGDERFLVTDPHADLPARDRPRRAGRGVAAAGDACRYRV